MLTWHDVAISHLSEPLNNPDKSAASSSMMPPRARRDSEVHSLCVQGGWFTFPFRNREPELREARKLCSLLCFSFVQTAFSLTFLLLFPPQKETPIFTFKNHPTCLSRFFNCPSNACWNNSHKLLTMPRPMSFFMEEDEDMLMDADANNVEHVPQHDPHRHHPQRQHLQQILLTESSGEDIEIKVPRRRAETWVHDETHSLIAFRRELDEFFNTSKSNKHLWEQIAARMSELGYDRTASMCTDKWRNLLKDYKKAQQRDGGSGKMYYEELEEFYAEKKRNDPYRKITSSRAPFMHISEKGEWF